MAVRVKRSLIATYVNTTPTSSAATYKLVGLGVKSGKVSMNPKVTEEIYINEDTARISVDGYAPNMPVEMTIHSDDPAFVYIDGIYSNRLVGSSCETDIVEVDLYKSSGSGAWPARKQPVSIQIDDKGGDGGAPAKINFTFNYLGAATSGSFNPTSASFT